MAKIIINHLGPISELTMEINQFNLLIGEQATGKSTICKAIYFFRSIKDELIRYLYNIAIDGQKEELFPKAINSISKQLFIGLFGYSWKLPENLNMKYIYSKDISIKVSLKKNYKGKKFINLEFSEQLKSRIKELEKQSLSYHDNIRSYDNISSFVSTERLRLHQDIIKKINLLFNDELETYYIPAGRSLLTLMTNQKTKLDYETIDLVNRKFMQFIENIQPKFDMGIANAHKYYPEGQRRFDVHKIAQEIIQGLKGEYTFENGQEYLKIPDSDEKVLINFISSGQQEILWLLNQLYILLLRNEKSFIIIEEPEAHLYPSLQKNVIDFIVQFMNITNSTIFVTTHSPYILNNVNNLYYAGKIIQNKNLVANVERTIGKYNYINPDKINVCKLISECNSTKCQNLLDEQHGEISTELIDEISESIGKTYSELFYLENTFE